jgi:hypothetical protein
VFCSKCGAEMVPDAKFCSKCGLRTKDRSSAGFFRKLANGDLGLAQTYWLYGVLVSIAFRILTAVIPSIPVIVILSLVWIAYSIPLYMGIWRAATRYSGPKVWSILAKIMLGLGIIALIVIIIGLLTGLGE